MALPSAGKKATATPDNPSSALTDFSFIVDLSDMPSTWWDDVNTTDGTRGRASKSNGTTELACDWIDFDSTAETGLVRILYSGTKSSSVDEDVIIYPPNTRNTAYGVNDTYGQYNAYDDAVWGYWPLHDGNDRTSNQRNLTANGSLSFGGAIGELGAATQINSSTSDYAETEDGVLFPFDAASTLISSIYCDDITTDRGILGTTSNQFQFWVDNSTTDYLAGFYNSGVGYGTTGISSTTWYHVAISRDLAGGSNSAQTYQDGSLAATLSESYGAESLKLRIGESGISKRMNGREQHISAHTVERSGDFISYEYSQTSDNSTFWGTWTVSDVGGGGYTLTAETGAFTLTGFDSSLLYDRTIKAETGAFSLAGFDASLLFDRQLTAESGSYILTGQEADLLYNKAITADAGAYALTGYDADLSLITGYQLIAETGQFTVTGFDASLLLNRVIETEAGSFVLTGYDATLNVLTGYTLDAEPGSYTLTGEDVNLLRDAVIQAEAGSYGVIGYPATLTYSGAVTLDPPDIIQTGGAIERYKTIAGAITINLTIKGELV